MKAYKNCQSCGMPLKKDPEGGGTNQDTSKSTMYCSYCYQGGTFTQPDFTAEEMQAFVVEKLVEMKFPRFLAMFFPKGSPSWNAGKRVRIREFRGLNSLPAKGEAAWYNSCSKT